MTVKEIIKRYYDDDFECISCCECSTALGELIGIIEKHDAVELLSPTIKNDMEENK